MEQIQAACREEGMEFEYSFLLDSLLEEQEQNITIDTTQIQFRTAKRAVRDHRCAGAQGVPEKHDHRRGQRGCGGIAHRRQ